MTINLMLSTYPKELVGILLSYNFFSQACGVLHAVEPLNSFLASLCKFTIVLPTDAERKRYLYNCALDIMSNLLNQC